MCFCKIENFSNGEINERRFSNPHPRRIVDRDMCQWHTWNMICAFTTCVIVLCRLIETECERFLILVDIESGAFNLITCQKLNIPSKY